MRAILCQAYQSYVQLADPQTGVAGDPARARYEGYFYPDVPGTYGLELRVHSATCDYAIVGTVRCACLCSLTVTVKEPLGTIRHLACQLSWTIC